LTPGANLAVSTRGLAFFFAAHRPLVQRLLERPVRNRAWRIPLKIKIDDVKLKRRPGLHGMGERAKSLIAFMPGDLKTGPTDSLIAHAGFLLYQLDELYELGNGIHTKQRQKPAIECKRLFVLAGKGETE